MLGTPSEKASSVLLLLPAEALGLWGKGKDPLVMDSPLLGVLSHELVIRLLW